MMEWIDIKNSFIKKQISTQQTLIKNLNACVEISLYKLKHFRSILKEER
jgi:hypothetical protein